MRFLAPWCDSALIRNIAISLFELPLDIFISTWDIAGVQKGKIQTHAYRWPEVKVTRDILNATFGQRLKDCKIDNYNPVVVTPAWLRNPAHDDMHLNQRISSMYYHVFEANRIKNEYARRQGITYDVTIRCRSDLNFRFSKVSAHIVAAEVRPNRVFVPQVESYAHTNDQFMFGDSPTMDSVAQMYHHIANRSPLIRYGAPDNPLHPAELIFESFLRGIGVEVKRCGIEYTRSS